jgi:thiamine biosynthesis lipoprotein
MKNKLIKLLTPLLVLGASSCSSYSLQTHVVGYLQVDSKFISAFDTQVVINTFSNDANEYVNKNFDSLVWSNHRLADNNYLYVTKESDTVTSTLHNVRYINDNGGQVINLSDELYQVLKAGVEFTKFTKGVYNIALKPVIDIWKEAFTNGILPSNEDIVNSLKKVPSYSSIDEYIALDDKEKTIQLNPLYTENEITYYPQLDLGSIAKGWALDNLATGFEDNSYPALISLGSSTLGFIGQYPGPSGEPWKLSYSNPSLEESNSKLLSIKSKKGMLVSTSSDSERNIVVNDEENNILIYSHLLDGLTGYSKQYYRTVSVISSQDKHNAMLLDALTTYLFSVEEEKFASELKRFEEYYSLDVDALYVTPVSKKDINSYNVVMSSSLYNKLDSSSLSSSIKSIAKGDNL